MSGTAPADRDGETARLVAAAAAGDHAAWEVLYRRYRPFMALITSAGIPDEMRGRFDTEDVLQSAFLSAWRGLGRFTYQGEDSFRGWLRQIAVRKLTDRIRLHSREKRCQSREADGVDPAGLASAGAESDTPSGIMTRAERNADVLQAISRLDEEHQEVIWLRNFEVRPWNEIARTLGCTESTARRRHFEALEALMRRCTESGQNPPDS
jgi:RNA polymerase sigma factor (sigma-70 family)